MKCDCASWSAVLCLVLPGCSLTTVMVIVDRATTRVRYRLLLLSVAVLYFSFQLSFSFEEIKNAWISWFTMYFSQHFNISLLHNSTSTMRLLVLVIMYNLPCYLLQFTFCSISQPKPWTIKLVPQIDPSVLQPVVQSRRRPLLGPSPGWKRLLALSHLRHY